MGKAGNNRRRFLGLIAAILPMSASARRARIKGEDACEEKRGKARAQRTQTIFYRGEVIGYRQAYSNDLADMLAGALTPSDLADLERKLLQLRDRRY